METEIEENKHTIKGLFEQQAKSQAEMSIQFKFLQECYNKLKTIKSRLTEAIGYEEKSNKYDFDVEKCLAVSEIISFLTEISSTAVV